MKYLRHLCWLSPAVLITGSATPARADLYGDAKDIIEQLIEDDIATQAVPNAAAKIPPVCEFFPETVAALADKRFSGLPIVLRGEVSDALGFLVMTQIYGDLDQLTKNSGEAQKRSTQARQTAVPTMQSAAPTAGDEKKTKSTTTAALDAARPLADWSKFEGRLADKRARLAIDSMLTSSNAGGMAEAAVSSESSQTEPPPTQYCAFPSMQTRASTTNKLPVAYESIASVALRACLAPQADLAAEAACASGLLTRDAAAGNSAALAPDARRLAAALAVSAEASAFTSWVPSQEQLVTLAEEMAAWLAKPTDGEAFAKTVCDRFAQPPDTCEAQVATAAAPLLSSALPLNIGTLDDALGLVATVSVQCTSDVCKKVNTIASGGEHIVSDIRAKNYGAAAGQVFDSINRFTNCQEHDKRDFCQPDNQKVYAFLQKLAVYSIDSLASNGGTSSAEGDFRKAAVDMIEAFAGEGVHRNLFKNAGFLYIPEFDLRYAWRPGHVNRNSSSPLLAYPSIDLLRGRISNSFVAGASSHVYYALTGSLLDPLGPLTEVATRDERLASDPARTRVFWEGFITPRADIEVGIPDLTKNLVVGGGTAIRLFRAQYNPGSTTPSYCELGSKCGHDSAQGLNWDNLELNVFVKYVP